MKKILIISITIVHVQLLFGQNLMLTQVDLSNYCPYKEHQFRATCYAYAFAYTALTINYCVKNNITDEVNVNNNAFSPGFIASMHRKQTHFNIKCGRNGSYDDDLNILSEFGCPKLKDFDLDCTTRIQNDVFTKAKETKLKDYKYIQNKQDTSQEAVLKIKQILSQKIPVLIVLNMTDDFYNLKRDCNEKLPIFENGNKSSIAHDICIIGYDDNPNSKFYGRFLVKNNFENWGDKKNMAWVKYSDMMYMITNVLYFTIQ